MDTVHMHTVSYIVTYTHSTHAHTAHILSTRIQYICTHFHMSSHTYTDHVRIQHTHSPHLRTQHTTQHAHHTDTVHMHTISYIITYIHSTHAHTAHILTTHIISIQYICTHFYISTYAYTYQSHTHTYQSHTHTYQSHTHIIYGTHTRMNVHRVKRKVFPFEIERFRKHPKLNDFHR